MARIKGYHPAGTIGVLVENNWLAMCEDYIVQLQQSKSRLEPGMDHLARTLALYQMSQAQLMSLGPYDPLQHMKNAAWKIPVRRITSRYYKGWKFKRLFPGIWATYNDSREAYYIEFGIHISRRRIRRPIRKLSTIRTLRWAQSSKVGHRIWDEVFAPMNEFGPHAQLTPTHIVGSGVQSPAVAYGMRWGL